MALSELVVGTICGGSDGTSGISANPAVGRAFDMLIEDDATCIFEETGELVGCEFHMKRRAATPELGEEIVACVNKAALLQHHGAWQLRARQRRRRPVDHRGKIAGRLCQTAPRP